MDINHDMKRYFGEIKRGVASSCENGNEHSSSIKCEEYSDQLNGGDVSSGIGLINKLVSIISKRSDFQNSAKTFLCRVK
jgi:hypothetical protein